MVKQINLFSPCLSKEDRQAVDQVLQGAWLTRGPQVEAFESELAEYVGAAEVVCVDNATNALNILYKALKDESSGNLWTTPITFASTATAGMLQGYSLKLFDEDPLNHDWSSLIEAMEEGDLFVPMHYGGKATSLEKTAIKAEKKRVILVEDACHALGSVDEKGFKVGSCQYSRATVFSFHPAKNITTLEGGAIATHDRDLALRLRKLRNNGIQQNVNGLSYDVLEPSLNAHMNEVAAVLGRNQLKKLDIFKKQRFDLMKQYAEELKGVEGIVCPMPDARNCYHLASVLIDFKGLKTDREKVQQQLRNVGIGTNVHYIPLYHFQGIKGFEIRNFPMAEKFYSEVLSLPLHCLMNSEDVSYIVSQLLQIKR